MRRTKDDVRGVHFLIPLLNFRQGRTKENWMFLVFWYTNFSIWYFSVQIFVLPEAHFSYKLSHVASLAKQNFDIKNWGIWGGWNEVKKISNISAVFINEFVLYVRELSWSLPCSPDDLVDKQIILLRKKKFFANPQKLKNMS